MNLELLQVGIGLMVALAAIFASNKNIKHIIADEVRPIAETLNSHTQKLDKLEIDYEITNANRAFMQKLNIIIEKAVAVLHEEDDEFTVEEKSVATEYLNFFGSRFIEVCNNVLLKGIDDVDNNYYSLKASQKFSDCTDKMEKLFGRKFAKDYAKLRGNKRTKYIKEVCAISDDWINSHDERYRNITLVYMQEAVNQFIRYYYKNIGSGTEKKA